MRLQRNRAVQYQCIRRDGNGGLWAYTKVEGFGFLSHPNSFTMALTTFVGQNLGAKQEERTKKGARIWNSRSSYIGRLIGVVVFLLAPQLIAAFDSSPEIIRFGVEKARTAALFYCLLAFSHSIAAILARCGEDDGVHDHYDDVLVRDPGVFPFRDDSAHSQHSGGILVYPLTWSLSSLAFFWYYKKAKWI